DMEPAPRGREGIFRRTDGGLAFVRQPPPLGGAVLEPRAEAFEQPGKPLAGGFLDRPVEVGEAYREDADSFGPVLAGDPDDRPAFPVVGNLDRDRAGQVTAR